MARRRPRKMPPDPEPWLRHLSPELRDNPKSVAWAKAKHEHDLVYLDFKRHLVDFYSLHRACPLGRCRRARRCVGREAPCYDAVLPLLRTDVFPRLLPALRKRAAEAAALRPESGL